ncbi:hypothetical protein BGZ89_008803, partial [Linnemannia elongata]
MKHTSAQSFTTLSVAVLLALLAMSAITPDLGSIVVQAAPLPLPEGSIDGCVGAAGRIDTAGDIGAKGHIGAAGRIDTAGDIGAKGHIGATGGIGAAGGVGAAGHVGAAGGIGAAGGVGAAG